MKRIITLILSVLIFFTLFSANTEKVNADTPEFIVNSWAEDGSTTSIEYIINNYPEAIIRIEEGVQLFADRQLDISGKYTIIGNDIPIIVEFLIDGEQPSQIENLFIIEEGYDVVFENITLQGSIPEDIVEESNNLFDENQPEENSEESMLYTEEDIKYNNVLGAPKASGDPFIYYHVSDDPNSDFYAVKYSNKGVVMGDYWGITDANSTIFAWEDENGQFYYPYSDIDVDSEMHLYPHIERTDKYSQFNAFVYEGVVFDSDLILYGTIEDPYHEENVVKFAEDSPYIPQSIYPFSHLTSPLGQNSFEIRPSVVIVDHRYNLIWSGGIGFSIPIEDILGTSLKLDYGIIGELNGRQVKAELIISEITPMISPKLADTEPIAIYFQIADVPTAGIFSTGVESCTYEIILKFVDNNHLLKNAAMTYSSLSFGQGAPRVFMLSYEAVSPISPIEKISLRADGTPNIYPALLPGRSFRDWSTYESDIPSLRKLVRKYHEYRGFIYNWTNGGYTLKKAKNEDYYYMIKLLGSYQGGIVPIETINDYLYITPFSGCIDANLSMFVPGMARYLTEVSENDYNHSVDYDIAQIKNGGFGRKYTEDGKEVRGSETFDRHAATIYYETSDMKFNMLSNYSTMWWTVEPHAWQEIDVIKDVNNNTPYKGETIEYTVTVTAETQDYVVFSDVADSGIIVDQNSIKAKNVEVSNWNYNIRYANNTISATLPPGVTTITYNAVAAAVGTFDNTATATIYGTELSDNDTEQIKVKPGNLKYKVVKVWDDDNSKNRPENITLTLYDNYKSDIISTSNAINTWVKEDNVWTYTFEIPEDVLSYDIIDSGTYDGVDWAVVRYRRGNIVQLQIGNMDEVQTMTDRTTRYNTDFPWYKYLGDGSSTTKVNSITFINKVIGNGSYRGMFRAFSGGTLDMSNFDCTNVTEMHNMLANVRVNKIIFNSTFAKAPGFSSLKNNSSEGFPIGNWTRVYDGQYKELTNQTDKDFTTIFNSISSTNSEALAGIWTTNQGGITPFSVYEDVPQGYTSDVTIDNKLNLTVGPNIIKNERKLAEEPEPKIEKYVNNQVHADIVNYDQPFTYSIMAYVPEDATGITITDTLEAPLQFSTARYGRIVPSNGVVIFKDNNHIGDGINGTVASPRVVGGNVLRVAGRVADNTSPYTSLVISENTISLTINEEFLDGIGGVRTKELANETDKGFWVMLSFEAEYKPLYYNVLAVKQHSSWSSLTDPKSVVDDKLSYIKGIGTVRWYSEESRYILKLGNEYYISNVVSSIGTTSSSWSVLSNSDQIINNFNELPLTSNSVIDGNITAIHRPENGYIINPESVTTNPVDQHAGTVNQASYQLEGNRYDSEIYRSNKVTVSAEQLAFELSKEWLGINGWPPNINEVVINIYSVPQSSSQSETLVETIRLNPSQTMKRSSILPKLKGYSYRVEEVPIQGYTSTTSTYTETDSSTEIRGIIFKNRKSFALKVSKQDNVGNLVANAILHVYAQGAPDSSNEPLYVIRTNGETIEYDVPLTAGKYVIKEVQTPFGYLSTDNIYFTVTEDNRIIWDNNEVELVTVINNRADINLTVNKETVDNVEGTFDFTVRIYKPEKRDYNITDNIYNNSIGIKLSTEREYLALSESYVTLGTVDDITYQARFYSDSKRVSISASESTPNKCVEVDIRYRATASPNEYTYRTFNTCSILYPDLTGQLGNMDSSGNYSFSLENGASITITDIPAGYLYKITETNKPGWLLESSTNTEGTINEDTISTFTNEINKYDLTINKQVTGNMGNKSKSFTFTLSIPSLANKTIKDSNNNNIQLNANGQYQFTLSHDQSLTIVDLPYGTQYSISESDYSEEGYKTKIDGKAGRVIESSIEQNTTHIVENINQVSVPTEIRINYLLGIAVFCISGIGLVLMKKYKKGRKQI